VHFPGTSGSGRRGRHQNAGIPASRFNPDRPNVRHHLSFGQGIHSCLGNVLARMEATTVLRELAQRVDRLEVVDPAAVRYLPTFFLRGIPELPVNVHPCRG
jgi:cytochrome P450